MWLRFRMGTDQRCLICRISALIIAASPVAGELPETSGVQDRNFGGNQAHAVGEECARRCGYSRLFSCWCDPPGRHILGTLVHICWEVPPPWTHIRICTALCLHHQTAAKVIRKTQISGDGTEPEPVGPVHVHNRARPSCYNAASKVAPRTHLVD